MIIGQNPILAKSYGIGLQKEGIVASRHLRISAKESSHYSSISQEHSVIKRNGLNIQSSFLTKTAVAVNMITSVRVLASLPNQKYINAIDLNKIKVYIMSMDPKTRSETENILNDPVIMEALQCADRQYREGKAIPLEDLMRELGFEEDEL